jgi:hypothetical protein
MTENEKALIIDDAKEIENLIRIVREKTIGGVEYHISQEEALKLIELAILLRK